jgi:hypothetical protein
LSDSDLDIARQRQILEFDSELIDRLALRRPPLTTTSISRQRSLPNHFQRGISATLSRAAEPLHRCASQYSHGFEPVAIAKQSDSHIGFCHLSTQTIAKKKWHISALPAAPSGNPGPNLLT